MDSISSSFNSISSSFGRLSMNLRYGVIYIALPFIDRDYSNGRERSFFHSPKIMSLLRSLTGYDIQIIDLPGVERPTLIARRINVGNAGKNGVVLMQLNSESITDLKRFAESATDVMSIDEGDKTLESESEVISLSQDHGSRDMPMCKLNRSCKPNRSIVRESHSTKKRSWLGWLKRNKKDGEEEYEDYFEESTVADDRLEFELCKYQKIPPTETEVEVEEDEVLTIEQEREQALKAIQAQIIDFVTKFHDDPSQLINTLLEGKIVIGGKEQLSPLVVNNDLKIVLPNYNEMEVKMPAMCRAIYILFLKHPEGIALRDIGDYRADLENIYSMVMPGRSEEKAKEAIDNLLDPMSNTLNEYISRIKRCFRSCIIDEKLASNYTITGKRGEPYRIALSPSLITLPRAVEV